MTTMLKLILFAFLSCGIVSAASAMSGWVATPGGVFGPEPPGSALATFDEAFLMSLCLLAGAAYSVYQMIKE
jgi:hypothetical protein